MALQENRLRGKISLIKANEITSFEELRKIATENDGLTLGVPLFHGTREYALSVPEDERDTLNRACCTVITFAQRVQQSGQIPYDQWAKYIREENSYFLTTVVSGFGKSTLFEYGDMYLTTSYPSAISFSNQVGGELCMNAYYQILGFEHFGISLDGEALEAAKIIRECYEKYASSERVVLVYYGIKITELSEENGSALVRKNEDGTYDENRLCRAVRKINRCRVTDSVSVAENYRLCNPEAHTPYIVRERDMRDGFDLFTDIKKLDYYLKYIEQNLNI